MRYKQLIYTSYKGYNGSNSGYNIYAQTPNIAEEDIDEITNLFYAQYVSPDYFSRVDDYQTLTQEEIDKNAPKQYAFLQLKSGHYCWAQVSTNARDYSGRIKIVYFHAVISEEKPTFKPIAFFEYFKFRSCLTKEEFDAATPPPELPEENIDDAIIVTQHAIAENCLNKEATINVLNAVYTALKNNKPLLINCDGMQALELFKEVFLYIPTVDSLKISFSTYSSDEEYSRAFVLNHIDNGFDYHCRMQNSMLVVADCLSDEYSETVEKTDYSLIFTKMTAEEKSHSFAFYQFLEEYAERVRKYSAEKVYYLYKLLYTTEFLRYPAKRIEVLLQDEYLTKYPDETIVKLGQEYLKNNTDCECKYQIYAIIYQRSQHSKSCLKEVLHEALQDVLQSKKKEEQLVELFKKYLNLDLYAELLSNFIEIKEILLANFNHETGFQLILNILKCDSVNTDTQDVLFQEVFDRLFSQGKNIVRDQLLPQITEKEKYFVFCVNLLYNSTSITAQECIEWISYCLGNLNKKIVDTFIQKALTDIVNRSNEILTDEKLFACMLDQFKGLIQKGLYENKIVEFIESVFSEEVSLQPDRLFSLITLFAYDESKYLQFIAIASKTLDGESFEVLLTNVVSHRGIAYAVKLSRIYESLLKKIIAKKLIDLKSYIEIYVKEFYCRNLLKTKNFTILDSLIAKSEFEVCLEYMSQILMLTKDLKEDPLAKHICDLVENTLWKMNHNEPEMIKKIVNIIADRSDGQDYQNVYCFKQLFDWRGVYSKELHNCIRLYINKKDEMALLKEKYTAKLLEISKVIYKKAKDFSLLAYFIDVPLSDCKKIWGEGFKKENKKLRNDVIVQWLKIEIKQYTNIQLFLTDYIFSSMSSTDYIKLYKKTEKNQDKPLLTCLKNKIQCFSQEAQNKILKKIEKKK